MSLFSGSLDKFVNLTNIFKNENLFSYKNEFSVYQLNVIEAQNLLIIGGGEWDSGHIKRINYE